MPGKPFLKAEWRKLALANYAVEPSLLQAYIPYQTELDLFRGQCYISLVGFMFLNVRLKGLRIPYHINFEEVNLRFYVRHRDNGHWKRGVTFISEIVPRPAIAFVANNIYKEKYASLPMRHFWDISDNTVQSSYEWRHKGRWNKFEVNGSAEKQPIRENSDEAFITEHYWGYTKLNNYKTSEYGVEHPSWEMYPVESYNIDVDFAALYGNDFAFLQTAKPISLMLAEGSNVIVRQARKIS